MFIPIRTDVPLRVTPWMNWLIILANMVMFFAQASSDTLTSRAHLDPRDPHLLNYFTYQFLHANFMHLLFNMLFLFIFGNNVNDRLGQMGYLAFYLAGGVIAGAAHVWAEQAPVIGASGAVFAVTGAFLILYPRAHVTLLYVFVLIGVLEIASMWFILAYFAINVINQFSDVMGAQSHVAHLAHLGGGLFGVVVCTALLAVRLLPRDPFDVVALLSRWNRRRQYRDIVAGGYDPFAYTPKGKGAGPDPRQERLQDLRAAVAEAVAHGNLPEARKLYLEMRAIDPQQVLSRQNQLDVANHLYAEQHHAPAADAYEGFLRFYAKHEDAARVHLMLGLLYSRYLNRSDLAEPHLQNAIARLSNPRETEMARSELAHVLQSRPPAPRAT